MPGTIYTPDEPPIVRRTMQTAQLFEKERLEVEALLASGIFTRAPNLAHLLKYVCDKYFDGAAEEIKEYNIAVEALGRRPEFDQKRDSIVRVEAHRLRKRLREYYESEGASHEVQIDIPSGQYTPRFVLKDPKSVVAAGQVEVTVVPAKEVIPAQASAEREPSALVPAVRETEPALMPAPQLASGIGLRWLVSAFVVVLIAGTALVLNNRSQQARVLASSNVLPPAGSGDEIRILCGLENGSYTDAFERVWQSDRFFTGGYPNQTPRNQIILGTRDQQIYRNRREGNFRYDIPLKPGLYELHLYFAETMYGENNVAGGGEAARLFEIRLNGKVLESFFDVIADAGSSTADIKVFTGVSPGPDGKIHLEFLPNTNTPFLNAIAILPGLQGRMRPYRIAARDRGLTDNQGRRWDPDHYARGGQIIARPNSNVPTPEPELFRSERFGNLTYSLPVAQTGKYTVSLYFSEAWFGPENPGGGGIGSRVFDILVNGVTLKKNFDIFRESGGANRALIVSARGVEPSHQGKIVISMIPNLNYACVNALEVIDESR